MLPCLKKPVLLCVMSLTQGGQTLAVPEKMISWSRPLSQVCWRSIRTWWHHKYEVLLEDDSHRGRPVTVTTLESSDKICNRTASNMSALVPTAKLQMIKAPAAAQMRR